MILDNKKKISEPVKTNKGQILKPGTASEKKENKIIPKENPGQLNKNNNLININEKINSLKPYQNDKIIKEIPYTKHYNINSNKTDQIIKGTSNHNKLTNNKSEKKEPIFEERKNTPNKSIYEINNIFKSDASKINSKIDLMDLDNFVNEKNFHQNKMNKKEEKINNLDYTKKPAYGSDRTKENKEKISNKNNIYNNKMNNGNNKTTKYEFFFKFFFQFLLIKIIYFRKTENINAKNFNFEEFQNDYLIVNLILLNLYYILLF